MLSIIYSNKKDLSSSEEYKIQCFVVENFINITSGAFVYNCKNIINRDYLIKIEITN